MGRRTVKRKEDRSDHRPMPYRQDALDLMIMAGTLILVLLVSLFPIRSNDVWWHLAVGKELIQTRSFITADPFTFTVTGSPWVPHAYLASIILYIVHLIGSFNGLIALRAILVLAVFISLFRIMKRAAVPFSLAAPFIILGLMVIQTRFIIRPHLFEYLFIMLFLGFLLFGKKRRGFRFYGPPVLLQILWVNTHASFYVGPVTVLIFLAGDGISRLLSQSRKFEWKPMSILLLLVIAASFVNPDPAEFVFQPMGGEQRELVTKYTIEWRSPFDPAMKQAAFHPYYEIFLALSLLSIVLALLQKRFAAVLLVGLFAFLSLRAHRFRVELVLVTLPLLLIGLKLAVASPASKKFVSRFKNNGPVIARAASVLLVALLVFLAKDRIVFGGGISTHHPIKAMGFIQEENIAHRPFHTIGFGSYMLWKLYPDRRSFIDGRNFHAGLYRDFIACQENVAGFQRVIDTYQVDSFILPVLGRSDSGIRNLHVALNRFSQWALVHVDSIAYVYVNKDAVPQEWLDRNAYYFYRPVTFANKPPEDSVLSHVAADIERILRQEPNMANLWADLAETRRRMKQPVESLEAMSRACDIEPDKTLWRHRLGTLAMQLGDTDRAIEAFIALVEIDPSNVTGYYNLAVAFLSKRQDVAARSAAEKALEIDPNHAGARELLRRLRAAE